VWSAGLGRAAAFTSDLKGRWGAAWTRWPGAARMIAQAARDVTRKEEDPRVRLEADASGGELSVRASVIGDDGRAQSFRRLVVHVAGPDGFSRELPLEATGAGAYTAKLPLSRPGTYVAVARDELTGEAVGTTGAAMTAGEELRPTGSDLSLLGRIAEFTGGKRRDTLAGIFEDRASKRFAYRDATPSLVFFAALALLLAVAARRLALPEAAAAWIARAGERLRAVRWGAAAQPAGAGATVGALLSARERGRAQREGAEAGPAPRDDGRGDGAQAGTRPGRTAPPAGAPGPQPGSAASWPQPGSWPRPGPTVGPQPGSAAGPQPAPPGGGHATGAGGAAPEGRPLTAAEKILARRRGRR
jgi:hypothetical protein